MCQHGVLLVTTEMLCHLHGAHPHPPSVWLGFTLMAVHLNIFHPDIHKTDNVNFQILCRANPLHKISMQKG